MTRRLYYDDSHVRQFTANIVQTLTLNDQPAVILDMTYFYPTGGGQPNDLGTINGVQVVDVISGDDGAILHMLETAISSDEATCQIDWSRRFDHMQHHTGQHILTQAFVHVANAQTVGFHLSADSVTIDLDRTDLTDVLIQQVETEANRVIFENRSVTAKIVDPSDLDDVRMRKMPEKIYTDGLRIIEVADFDKTACGGTHVNATGEIGLIKVIKTERRGDKTRVEFRCGHRAIADYDMKSNALNGVVALLTCHPNEVTDAVERMQAELKQALRVLKQSSNQLLDFEAPALLADADSHDGIRVIFRAYADRDANDIRGLATRLTEHDDVIALLATSGEKAHLVFARSENLSHDMNVLLKGTLAELDGRGGGRPNMAQGGGVPASTSELETALNQAIQRLFG